MAKSGTVLFSVTSREFQGKVDWTATSNGPEANSSKVKCTLYARRDSYGPTWGTGWSGYLLLETEHIPIDESTNFSIGSSWVEMASVERTIAHDPDGSRTITVGGLINGSSSLTGYTTSGQQYVQLDKIPRYATGVSFEYSEITFDSVKISWKANETCSAIKYSLNSGEFVEKNVNAKSGSFTIKNLTPGTTYNIRFNVKRKDSGLYLQNNIIGSFITRKIAVLTSVPDVTIRTGNTITQTIKFHKYFTSTVTMILATIDGTTIQEYTDLPTTVGDKTYNLVVNTSEITNRMGASTDTYRAKIILKTESTSTSGAFYSDEKTFTYTLSDETRPDFSGGAFTYRDTNSVITNLTGNNQTIVKGYSNIQVSLTNGAIAKEGGTISGYFVSIGNNIAPISVGSSATINAVNGKTITITATDSRGKSSSIEQDVTTYLEYTLPTIQNCILERSQNGTGTDVTLTINGTYWNNSFGSVSNTIQTIRYRYKKGTDSSYGNYKTLSNISMSSENYSYIGYIEGDLNDAGTGSGYSVDGSFIIEFEVTDKLGKKTREITLGQGQPAIAFYKNNISIGEKYDTIVGGKLQLHGDVQLYAAGSRAAYHAVDTKNNKKLFFGVGSQTPRRGMYDETMGSWIIAEDDEKIYLNGFTNTGSNIIINHSDGETTIGGRLNTKRLFVDGVEISGGSSGAVTGVKGNSETTYRTGNVNITKANLGLGNVENKSSATIRGEITSSNVTSALGYTPAPKMQKNLTDFNSLESEGTGLFIINNTSGGSITNAPATNRPTWFVLQIKTTSSAYDVGTIQFATHVSNTAKNLFRRCKSGGTWGSWYSIAFS